MRVSALPNTLSVTMRTTSWTLVCRTVSSISLMMPYLAPAGGTNNWPSTLVPDAVSVTAPGVLVSNLKEIGDHGPVNGGVWNHASTYPSASDSTTTERPPHVIRTRLPGSWEVFH